MLQAIGLTEQYGEYAAWNSLDSTVLTGEIHCLLRQKYAGKYTITLFLKFIQPTPSMAQGNDMEVTLVLTAPTTHLSNISEVVQSTEISRGWEPTILQEVGRLSSIRK